jgi:D-alanyl-D-alanine carboxypeptidase (penicillin-binding protein 5/6)
MKKLLFYLVSILFLTVFFSGIFYFLRPPASEPESQYTSPLPEFLTLGENRQVRLLDLWLPIIQQTYGSGFDVNELSAQSVLMYDMTTNKALFEKAAKVRRPMASLTKIMTAIVSLENKRSDDRYVVTAANLVGEDSMGLEAGEVLTQEELLYGLMLPSGNDAAEVLATNFPNGGRTAFLQAMDDKAKALGLADTRFSNPSGLQGDGVQYTTAYDLLVMTRYALDTFPEFAQIVSTYDHVIPANSTHKEYHLFNETNLLSTYPGVHGVKTGYTPEAGLCLVTYLTYRGHRIIGVLLNSESRRTEMKELLDASLKVLGIEPPAYTG